MVEILLNGEPTKTNATPETPLVWVLREHLGLTGTKFGCGVGLCGACTVHVGGEPTYSCQITLGDIGKQEVTTIEGLSPSGDHPLQKAWVAEQVPQCGYCQSGQIMRAAALLKTDKNPSRDKIRDYMSSNLCRCGTYTRIFSAIERAAKEA